MDDNNDDELLKMFVTLLDSEGIVAAQVDDGFLLGIALDKLQELISIAQTHDDKRVIILIPNEANPGPDKTEFLN